MADILENFSILKIIGEGIAILSILGITVQWIKPIKIYPVTWFFDFIRRNLFKDVMSEIKSLRYDVDTNEIDRLKTNIRTFSTDVKHGCVFTREQWEDTFYSYEKYNDLLKRNGKTNGYTKREMEFLRKEFDVRNAKNDFLN